MNAESRAAPRLVGAMVGLGVVALATLLLPPESIAADVFLDRKSQIFPYPLTIQNIMTIAFFVGLGELYRLRDEVKRQSHAMQIDLLPEAPDAVLTYDDLPLIRTSLARVPIRYRGFLSHLIESCAAHYVQTRSTAEVLALLEAQVRMEDQKVDLRYSVVRYLAWFLPTVGFIGTVVGIAAALNLAAIGSATGNMSDSLPAIVGALAVAFNTTILSLIYSAILVFGQTQVQTADELMIVHCGDYCIANLVRRLRTSTHHR
jgi:biopolymer transport protein ExbB/TolQ